MGGRGKHGGPVHAKCPKCKRGKWGHSPTLRGVHKIACEIGRGQKHHSIMECLDCGHLWRSTWGAQWIFDAKRLEIREALVRGRKRRDAVLADSRGRGT